LREQGAEVDIVEGLEMAGQAREKTPYDLICADSRLNEAFGSDIVDELTMRFENPQFVITGENDCVEARRFAEELGAMAYMPRPYFSGQLRSLIRHAMAERRRRKTDRQPPRILMYSHDTIGLGHMRRNANIATALLRERPEASVLMLIGCPAGFVFDMPPGMDFVKLPSLVKQSRHEWRPDQLNISAARARELRSRLIREAVAVFEPDAVLVDHVPAGVWGELTPALQDLNARSQRPFMALGLRDILDDPREVRKRWRNDGTAQVVGSFYDQVFIYGEKRLFDTADAYGLAEMTPNAVDYLGYVAARSAPEDRENFRRRLAIGDKPLLIVTGRGGRDAFPLMRASLDALALIEHDKRPATIMVPGPLMDTEQSRCIHEQAFDLGVKTFDRLSDMAPFLAAADMMIGMAGYNSTVEALAEGVPALIVPRNGPSAEQRTRASLFNSKGLIESLPIEAVTPQGIASHVANIRPRAGALSPIDTGGANRAAARLVEAIDARQRVPVLERAS
jgi:predicted glycosyltransferase